jgi:nitrogen regulatory protein P-II 1
LFLLKHNAYICKEFDGGHLDKNILKLKQLNQKMKKIEAIIRQSKFEEVKQALYDAGIDWFSYWDITGLGKSTEDQVVRGQVFQSNYIQRKMLSIVVRDQNAEKTVQAIIESAKTGEAGDGKIFIMDIENSYRIRNGEQGPESLYTK